MHKDLVDLKTIVNPCMKEKVLPIIIAYRNVLSKKDDKRVIKLMMKKS